MPIQKWLLRGKAQSMELGEHMQMAPWHSMRFEFFDWIAVDDGSTGAVMDNYGQ